jgi:hypothetical protein
MTKPSLAIALATVSALSAFVSGCAAHPLSTPPPLTSATPPSHVEAKRSEPGHIYRLDFVVSSNNAAPGLNGTPGNGAFTMSLEERHRGEIMTGSNVALTSSGGSRVDVGMKLKADYSMVGDDILLESNTELSAAESGQPGQPSTIHKLTASGEALVTPGRPTLVASADDPQGHSSYRLTVTATKLR